MNTLQTFFLVDKITNLTRESFPKLRYFNAYAFDFSDHGEIFGCYIKDKSRKLSSPPPPSYSFFSKITYPQLEILLLSHLCSLKDCTSPSDTTINLPSCLLFLTTLILRTATWPGKTWISSTTTGRTPCLVSADNPFTAFITLPLSGNDGCRN